MHRIVLVGLIPCAAPGFSALDLVGLAVEDVAGPLAATSVIVVARDHSEHLVTSWGFA